MWLIYGECWQESTTKCDLCIFLCKMCRKMVWKFCKICKIFYGNWLQDGPVCEIWQVCYWWHAKMTIIHQYLGLTKEMNLATSSLAPSEELGDKRVWACFPISTLRPVNLKNIFICSLLTQNSQGDLGKLTLKISLFTLYRPRIHRPNR